MLGCAQHLVKNGTNQNGTNQLLKPAVGVDLNRISRFVHQSRDDRGMSSCSFQRCPVHVRHRGTGVGASNLVDE